MPGPRNPVQAPSFVDRSYGLLSVVQPRYDVPDQHWRNGVIYQNLCGIAGSTFDDLCATGNAPPKTGNMTTPIKGAVPFTVFAEVDCPPIGYTPEEQQARARDALTRTEGWQVERAFWTGSIGPTGGVVVPTYIVFPHLAANAQVTDPSIVTPVILQTAATTVTGSTVVDIVEGLGMLEAGIGNCYTGQAVIHIPAQLAEQCYRAGVVETRGQQVFTKLGNLVAFGTGYTGSGPDGTILQGALWIYATGQLFAYRTPPEAFEFKTTVDRAENTVRTIVERTYVIGWDCCHFAVPVSVGGIVTGVVGAPN